MNKIGLALSGGGYRAAAFHLGTLRALHKMGVLDKVDVMSTISGGSITGAAWGLFLEGKLRTDKSPSESKNSASIHDDFPVFEKYMVDILNKKSVIRFILTSFRFITLSLGLLAVLTGSLWLSTTYLSPWAFLILLVVIVVLVVRFQFWLFPVSKDIERAYNKFFFHKATLADLPSRPDIAIGSTNLLSTTPFTFSRRKMGDSNFEYAKPPIGFKQAKFPVARAVMASSCVPFAFTPVTIGKEFYEPTEAFNRTDTKLVDGGVFDNQGIHKLTYQKSSWYCPVVVVSDAGNLLPFRKKFRNTIALLIRTVDVFMDRIKDFQMAANVYMRSKESTREIAFISLGWNLAGSIPGFVSNMKKGQVPDHVIDSHGFEEKWKTSPEEYTKEITDFLIETTGYVPMENDEHYIRSFDLARNVGTNLTKLSLEKIHALAWVAELSTTIQVKLYCPSLRPNK